MGCVVSGISGEIKNVMGQSIWDVTDVFGREENVKKWREYHWSDCLCFSAFRNRNLS